jgi:hypothetical protein
MMAESTQDAILKQGHPAFVAYITYTTLLLPTFQISNILQNVFRQDCHSQLGSQDPVCIHAINLRLRIDVFTVNWDTAPGKLPLVRLAMVFTRP